MTCTLLLRFSGPLATLVHAAWFGVSQFYITQYRLSAGYHSLHSGRHHLDITEGVRVEELLRFAAVDHEGNGP